MKQLKFKTAYGEVILNNDFCDVSSIANVRVDLKYATKNNFMNENLYGELRSAFLHKVAFEKLKNAAKALQARKPGWQLLVYDAFRPRSVQRAFYARVRGTPQEPYVANPEIGSIHNFGMAVDLSLLDQLGNEVDMGTPFDDFRELAQPILEDSFFEAGLLSAEQIANREILRAAMTQAGFIPLPYEWWHFDALPAKEVRSGFVMIE